jgi:hypothetical protein
MREGMKAEVPRPFSWPSPSVKPPSKSIVGLTRHRGITHPEILARIWVKTAVRPNVLAIGPGNQDYTTSCRSEADCHENQVIRYFPG